MVPSAYVRLDALPLTTTGKVDRMALPAPDVRAYSMREYEAPRGQIETALASIWAEVLGIERIDRHDDFFAIGGHSLLAIRVISRIADYFGVSTTVHAIFSANTVARLAAAVEQQVYEDIARMSEEDVEQARASL
jgi:acyl carrier protein